LHKKIIIIGGGAAGYFTAINIAEQKPEYHITILEKAARGLQKVKVSGGGRCNVTNGREKTAELVKFYPRGGKKLYKTFEQFGTLSMVEWLKDRGVQTKVENDLRVFPTTDNSQTIIDCFERLVAKHGIDVHFKTAVEEIQYQTDSTWKVFIGEKAFLDADIVVVASGSSPSFQEKLKQLDLTITPQAPSLFTFNIKDERISALPGVSFAEAEVRIQGTKLVESGPLLITHWGMSGPAILKLSAWGARELKTMQYDFSIIINFLGSTKPDAFRTSLLATKTEHPTRKVYNYAPDGITKRYWENLLLHLEVPKELPFGELTNKHINKLTEEITQAIFEVKGKSTFKEEFVTCGGVDLSEIDLVTMASKKYPSLYFAGEVIDIDALTGGFNFQACWSAGWIVAKAV
jgi:predicted Rossmann fold flavoprotein